MEIDISQLEQYRGLVREAYDDLMEVDANNAKAMRDITLKLADAVNDALSIIADKLTELAADRGAK